MMTNFMSYHIGHRKIAWRLETILEFFIKGKVDVEATIGRAIKRTGL